MYNHIHEFSKLILRFFNKNCDENSSSLRNSFRVQSSTDTTLCFMSLLCILPKARCYLHMITARVGMYILVNHLYTHLQRVGVGYFKQLKKSARDALRSAKKIVFLFGKEHSRWTWWAHQHWMLFFWHLNFWSWHSYIDYWCIFVVEWGVLGPLFTMQGDLSLSI